MPTAIENLEMGPCNVTFNSTDLGLTKGGVEVEFGTEVASITTDQHGDSIINDYIKGRSVKVKVPMAERDLAKLAAVIPGSTLVTDGTDATIMKLVINAAVGTSLRDFAGPLVLKPKDATDDKKNVTVPLAMAKGDMTFAFKHDDQRIYAVEFNGYVDLDTGELWILGDTAAAA